MSLTEYLSSIANAIREKTGSSGKIPAMDFPEMIRSISSSGGKDFDTGIYIGDRTVGLARSKYTYAELPIKHSLGRVPKFVYFGYDKDNDTTYDTGYVPENLAYSFCFGLAQPTLDGVYKPACQFAARTYNTAGALSTGYVGTGNTQPIISADADYIYIHGVDSSQSKVFANVAYRWLVF